MKKFYTRFIAVFGMVVVFAVSSWGANVDLTLSFTDTPDPVNTGQPLTYSVGVYNSNLNKADNVKVTVPLPSGTSYVSGSGCSVSGSTVTCDFGTINKNSTKAGSFIVNAPSAAGSIEATATVTTADTNLNSTKVVKTTTQVIAPSADLSIAKTVDKASPDVGDNVTFTIIGRNNGTQTTDIIIQDTLPASLQLISSSDNGKSYFDCTNSGNAVTCTGTNNIDSGETVTITIVAKVLSAGTITNTATIASTESVPDNNLANNSASVSLTAVIPVAKANNDTYSTGINVPLSISSSSGLLVNDKGIGIYVTGYQNPTQQGGTVAVSGDGSFTYTPPSGFTGNDTFTYSIVDASGNTSQGNVTINVATLYGGFHPFDRINPENTRNIRGNYAIAGNTVMCLTEKTSGYGGTCQDAGYEYITSNMHVSKYIDIDGTGNNTWNSTSSYITIPNTFDNTALGGGILWAGLFWQGRISTDTNYVMHYGKESGPTTFDLIETGAGSNYGTLDIKTTGAETIKLKVDNGNYNDTQAATFYTYSSDGGTTYAAFSEVTSILQNSNLAAGKHVFTVANLTTNEGREPSPGVFGGWSLVVIYSEGTAGKIRNISVYSGFDSVGTNNAPFAISGFKLPSGGAVNSTLSLFSGEGEYLYGYNPTNTSAEDWVKISNDNSNYSYMPNALHDRNIFDGVMAGVYRDEVTGYSNNLQINNDGVDIDSYDVSSLMTSYRDANPALDTMYIKWYSNNDYITPSMLTFATQLYEPKLCYDYSIKQDGRYLTLDRATYPKAHIEGAISSSPIDVMVFLRNEEADLLAEGISFKADVNDSRFDYGGGSIYVSNPNGSALIDRGVPTFTDPLCAYNTASGNALDDLGCTNGHDIRKGNGTLGSKEYLYTKFTLNPQEINGIFDDVNESLGMKLDYYITVAGNKIPYQDYELGGNVPICTPSNIYQPAFGLFNVITDTVNKYNNINTQVSRQSFNASVIFDSTPATGDNAAPAGNVNSTVLVEMIDVDSFGDINASCANPDAAVSQPIFVPVAFTNTSYQTAIPIQDATYHNFALKNGAFRVWYFTDKAGTLRQWSPVGLSNANKSITGITTGLYDSASHPACAASCSTSTSLTCYNCMKANYAKPLCSRDNFSVRPEAFDIRLSDNKQGVGTVVQSLTDSPEYGYSPDRTPPLVGDRIDLAAGYNYRFDVNATGHEDTTNGFAAVPRYTRYFSGARSDYNATMYHDWDITSPTKNGCNDTADKSLNFFILNGTKADQQDKLSQVGDYRLNMIDTTWTAVDQIGSNAYRTSANSFRTVGGVVDDDCIDGAETTVLNNGKIGCIISSQHSNGGLQYRDQNLTFHPYKFVLNGAYRIGEGDAASTPPNILLTGGEKRFVYMADINNTNEMNMSVRGDYMISAQGADNTTLSNFVRKCYAVDVDLTLDRNHSINQPLVNYQARFSDKNTTSGVVLQHYPTQAVPINASFLRTVDDSNFTKDGGGRLATEVRLNYDRNPAVVVNPITVGFKDYNATCTNHADCAHSADLIMDRDTNGSVVNGYEVTHYYGRAQGQYTRVRSPVGQITALGNARVNFEIFCGQDGFSDCNPALVANPLALPSNRVAPRGEDRNWYLNLDHNDTDPLNALNHDESFLRPYGRGDVGLAVVNASEITNNVTMSDAEQNAVNGINVTATKTGFERYGISYDGANGYPYSVIIQNDPSPWLIYNPPGDANPLANEYSIEFNKESSWIGESTSGQATDNEAAINTSRRIMW